jgi:NAD(P)H-dependent FMN reductase
VSGGPKHRQVQWRAEPGTGWTDLADELDPGGGPGGADRSTQVLLISGSLRSGSTNTALLATAEAVAPAGLAGVVYDGVDELPHFNPDHDAPPLHSPVADLRARIGRADALLFSTPEYAGALPGSFKNLLDWTVGGGEIYGKPVAWVNASASPTGAADAHQSLRTVLGYVGAVIVEPACADIPVARNAIGPDGLIADPSVRARLGEVLEALRAHVEERRAVGVAGDTPTTP